jgi:hypothetical protein
VITSKTYLINQLTAMENAKRVNRLRVANLVLENQSLFKHLLDLTFEINNKLSIRAAWVLEFVCEKKLDWLAPYLNYFTKNIGLLKFDSAVRPASKICEFLAKAYTSNDTSFIQSQLKTNHINIIIETCFDWLIGNQKVAVKAYAMETLFLFGKNEEWVHQELQLILQHNMIYESAAYQARGKKILSWIRKK